MKKLIQSGVIALFCIHIFNYGMVPSQNKEFSMTSHHKRFLKNLPEFNTLAHPIDILTKGLNTHTLYFLHTIECINYPIENQSAKTFQTIFKGCPQLESFTLQGSTIDSIYSKSFEPLPQNIIINLNANKKLTYIEPDAFDSRAQNVRIYLFDCPLSTAAKKNILKNASTAQDLVTRNNRATNTLHLFNYYNRKTSTDLFSSLLLFYNLYKILIPPELPYSILNQCPEWSTQADSIDCFLLGGTIILGYAYIAQSFIKEQYAPKITTKAPLQFFLSKNISFSD